MKYKSGYKYQLYDDYEVCIPELSGEYLSTNYIGIHLDGRFVVAKGYAWDGPSGIAIDTKNFMRGSLVHDALYQLIREGGLPQTEAMRELADKILRHICLEDGMSRIRAWWIYRAVRMFGGWAASPRNRKKVLVAP